MKADERKKQILDAALIAFAEHGYERTSIAIICKKAGIARPTLYQYFDNKQSLFRALLENYLFGFHEEIHARQQAKDDEKDLSQRETMQSLHQELLEEIANNRDFYTILFKEAKARNAETEDIVKEFFQLLIHKLAGELESELGPDEMSRENIEFAVVYMIGGMMQTIEYYLFDDERALSTQEFAERLTFIESRIKGI
ncbi:MAG: TetR/AcrR family transcriptional regulator, partial [Anaerolineales bacterium]|nr:TetR/AcrR family transcriptional regulator [Anaerolineales bacterium]